eukprot:6153521-Pyramimonas_sp.AAC.1
MRIAVGNAVVYSSKGAVTSAMAGGDLDGDETQLTVSPKLIELMHFTELTVEREKAVILERKGPSGAILAAPPAIH